MNEQYHLELKRMRAELKACEQEERVIDTNCKSASGEARRELTKATRQVNQRIKSLERERAACLRGVERRRQGISRRLALLQGRLAS